MKTNYSLLVLSLLFFGLIGSTQTQLTQTVRGTLLDADSKLPIIGAKIVLVDSNPFKGGITNENGDFRIEGVPVGRVSLRITSYGYLEITLPSVLVESGNEKILQLEMTPDVKILDQVEVTSQKDKSETINKMATVSAKSFTVEETNRYAGSLNDPARMVSGFAGVTGNAEGDNDIVVRGNSPRGILWRLDGIDIPNPNHFSNNGATGGPISALNGAVLANSDFFSGAFAPEYGNALSGVFDVKMREGNNEKREYSFSVGALGIDASVEGPFKKGYRGSYLVNYRYSSVGLLDKAGLLDFGGVPIYQDGAFKFNFPTKNAGLFTIIGFGGISRIDQTNEDSLNITYEKYSFRANLGVGALKHTYIVNPKLYFKSYVTYTTSYNGGEGQTLNNDSIFYLSAREGSTDDKFKIQTIANYNLSKKNSFQLGATYTRMFYNFFFEHDYDDEDGILKRFTDSKGKADVIQSFISWKFRITNDLTLISGAHFTQFLLNNHAALEPRAAIKWELAPRHSISAGFGLHSRLESPSVYLYNELQTDGTYKFPNKNLDLSKSAHYVVGYGFRVSENLHFKTEVYYQQLYNIPVAKEASNNFNSLNFSSGVPDFELINTGKGRNFGTELTLERFFQNNFYYLVTGSLYKSLYTTKTGEEKGTRFDAGFATNVLLGKEFQFGQKKNNNKTFGINTKVSLIGGNRYTPIDLQASRNAGYEVRDVTQQFELRGDNIFFLNLGLTYRCDMQRASHSFKIDIQNLTNHKAAVNEYYNSRSQQIEKSTQLSIIPNIIYTIKF